MSKELLFRGAATALVTPFCDRTVDFHSLGNLIEEQIAQSIDALVICGTTGEASTLSDEERRACIRFTVEKAAGRVPVIAGCGANATARAVALSRYADEVGVDGILVVTPYYNKATTAGLISHYRKIADAVHVPLILYNVPSRTGVDLPIAVCKELSRHERIVGIKEASGNLNKISEIAAVCGDDLPIYSGDDGLILPVLSVGGVGVISVVSNLLPHTVHDICAKWFANDPTASAKTALALYPLIRALFAEVNPVPLKYAMQLCGKCGGELRLPLCTASEETKARLREILAQTEELFYEDDLK